MKVYDKYRKFQEGGAMEEAPVEQTPEQAPEGAGQDPMVQLIQAAAQAVQAQDCNIAMQVCQVLVQLAQGGGQEAPAEEPTYAKRGGKLVRIR